MLAGLQGVPDELAEAAQIDGASWWQIQRHITLPLLAPTIRIWAFLSIIGSLQAVRHGLGHVAPAVRGIATETMATYMVQQGQFAGQPGYGSAIAVILFVISLAVALDLPALRAAPRSRRRRHPRGALMSSTIEPSATPRATPAPDAGAGRASTGGSRSSTSSRSSSSRRGRARALRLHRRLPHHRRHQREPRRDARSLDVPELGDRAHRAAVLGQRARQHVPGDRDHGRRRDRRASWRRSSSRATTSAGAACCTRCSPRG